MCVALILALALFKKKDGGSLYDVYGGGGATFKIDRYNRENCFIVSRFAMSPKCTRFVKGKFFLNDSGLSVSTKEKKLTQDFVDKFLLSNNDKIYGLGKGAAQRNLEVKAFKNMDIPVPPLAEQQRIVAELDLLMGIIDKQNAQLKELDTLAQSIFYDMFGDPIENPKGWEVKKLSDVCSLITDGVHAKPDYVEDGVPFISVKDITTGKLMFDDVKYVSASDHATMFKRCPVANGDILYTKVGATYGRPALVDTDKEFSLYVSVALLKPWHDVVNNVFLCHQMATDFVKHQADKSIKGIGVPDLHLNMIRNFRILVPPKSLQLEFNSRIAYVEKQKLAIKASIADTQKLLDYTMDKYFG